MEHEMEFGRVLDGEGELIVRSHGDGRYQVGPVYVTITPGVFEGCMDVRMGFPDGGANVQSVNGRELRALAELVDMLADAHYG